METFWTRLTLTRVCIALAAGALMVGAAACGDDDDDDGGGGGGNSTSEQSEGTTIESVAFLDESITSFTKPMEAGAQEVADREGIELDFFSADHDPQKQLQQCQDALARGKYQALLIYPPDPVAIQPCVKQALEQDVIVVPVDQNIAPEPDTPELQIEGLKGMVINILDEDVAGTVELVDRACAEDKKPPCRIVKTVSVPPYHYSAYKLEKEIPMYKDKGYEVVATPTIGAFDDPDGMVNAIRDVLTKTQDIDVLVSDDDSSVQGAVRMKKEGELPEQTLIIGDGGSKPAVESIQAGRQFGTIFNMPKTMGAEAMEMALKIAAGETIEDPVLSFKDMANDLYLLTKENSEGVQAEW